MRLAKMLAVVMGLTSVAVAGEAVKSAQLSVLPAGINTSQGVRQLLVLEVDSDGLKDVTCTITAKEWSEPVVEELGDLAAGKQRIELQLMPIPVSVHVQLQSGAVNHEFDAVLAKPRQWFIYLVQHTHTDIGYTRRQSEILPEHLRYIDEAMDACDQTDDYPDDAQFRWTCEVSWTVREYLQRCSEEQAERLKKCVAQGRIEAAAMFLNMSEIATESSLAASLQPVRTIAERLGTSPRLAMQNDVNGAGWCLPDYFDGIGVRYLTMGINQTRSILPFDKPTAFWWESPSGKRTLAFRSDHYMTANFWGIQDGKLEPFAPKCLEYLTSLEQRKYPFDRVAVQYSGYFTDNSRPSVAACDLVRAWNEKYAWPRLRIATASEFPAYVEANHAESLPVHRQAWPDWWTDGFGSAARETAESRESHAAMQGTQGLLALSSLLGVKQSPGIPQRIAQAQEQLLFYDEHTFGAAESISDPMCQNSLTQWGEKGAYAWEAVKNAGMLREEAFGTLRGLLPRSQSPLLVVFNTLSWQRSGLVTVMLDSAVLPHNRQIRVVDLQSGQEIAVQGLHRGNHGTTAMMWVDDVPPLGYRSCRIEVLEQDRPAEPTFDAQSGVLENAFYALAINPQTAAVTSLRDKQTGQELVDGSAKWNLGQLIYERIKDTRDLKPEAFSRSSVREVKLVNGAAGPIFKSICFEAVLDGCAPVKGVQGEIRLYEKSKQIEFVYSIRKLPVAEAEAVYVAFPFQMADSKVVYEGQGGCVTPGEAQLPGSASDWQTVQRFAALRNSHGQIVCASNRVPLVQFGDINLGKWQRVAKVDRPHLYSWVMNNYWFTNFRATQEGQFAWSYHLTSTADASNAQATRFGWNSCVPLAARVILPGKPNDRPIQRSMLRCDASNLLLVEARPAAHGDGVVLHWRELEGKPAVLELKNQPFAANVRTVDEVTVLEQPVNQDITSVSFAPHEVKFVRVNLK